MPKDKTQSILSKRIHPVKLGLITILLMIAMMLILRMSADQQLESNKLFYWEISLVFLMAYALFSCVFSLNAVNKLKYFITSILIYIAIVIIGIVTASFFSGLAIDEAASFEWMFKLFSICYLILISVFNLMSTVIELLRKQDEDVQRQQNNKTS